MSKRDNVHRRVEKEFAEKFLDDIRLQRLKNGKDKKPISDTRIFTATRRHGGIKKIKDDIINADLLNNKRGQGDLGALFVWVIIGFITVAILGTWIFAHALLTEGLLSAAANSPNDVVNLTEAVEQTFVQVNNALPLLHTLTFMMIFTMGLAILIFNFFIRAHPVYFAIHVFMTVIAVIFSVVISNAYESALLLNPTFGTTFQAFTATNFIMANLPMWTAVIGIFGAMLLFINITRDKDLGGSI